MRPFLAHQNEQPLTPDEVYRLRVELLPMSFLARAGDRLRLEISNQDSLIADAPLTHFYGQKVGTDTYHHGGYAPLGAAAARAPLKGAVTTQVHVIGATGPSLGVITAGLAASGAQVRALIRDPEHADHARANGASQTVVGDLRDPQSLAAAAEDMDAVFHANPAFAPDEADLGRAMVRAAADARVAKFVFLSVYHPTLAALRNHADKQPVEAALFESDLNFTILQAAIFMQNLAGAWDGAVASGQLVMPYSTRAKTSYVDLRDVADVAALAVTTDRLDYGTFELASPGMVDTAGIADLMSAASGRPIEARAITVGDWLARTRLAAGPLRDGLGTMMRHYDRHGFHGGNDLVLRAILQRQPRTMPEFITELARGRS